VLFLLAKREVNIVDFLNHGVFFLLYRNFIPIGGRRGGRTAAPGGEGEEQF
jgi:hypothetical protein